MGQVNLKINCFGAKGKGRSKWEWILDQRGMRLYIRVENWNFVSGLSVFIKLTIDIPIVMLIFYIYMQPVLFLLTTALLTAYGFQRDHPIDEFELGYDLEGGTNFMLKRNAEKANVWLGPRLGRKKRSEDDLNIIARDKSGGALIEILQDAPWALIPFKGSPRRSTTFTPRLGRDSDEEYTEDGAVEVVYGKTGARAGNHATGTSFTPRLGRHANLFNHQHL